MEKPIYDDKISLLGEQLRVIAFFAGNDIHVSILGGTKPHIGAISILCPDGKIKTTCFPTHKDNIVSEKWAESLRENGIVTAIVEVGIHYDNLTKEDISAVLAATDALLDSLLRNYL